MSLAAVPAYLLARRLLPALVALARGRARSRDPVDRLHGHGDDRERLLPAVPPDRVAARAHVLERPTVRGQLLLLALIAIAYAIRVQAIALVPAALTAPALLALFERRRCDTQARSSARTGSWRRRELRWWRSSSRADASLSELLGAYRVVGDRGYDVRLVLDYLVWHLAELDLYVAVLPFAATIVLLASAASLPRPRCRRFLAATIALTGWLLRRRRRVRLTVRSEPDSGAESRSSLRRCC